MKDKFNAKKNKLIDLIGISREIKERNKGRKREREIERGASIHILMLLFTLFLLPMNVFPIKQV